MAPRSPDLTRSDSLERGESLHVVQEVTPLVQRRVRSEAPEDTNEGGPLLRRSNGDDAGTGGGKEGGHEATEKADQTEVSLVQSEEDRPMTLWEVARTALIFCPIWFAANYSFNKAVSMTSVSSNTVLSSTSSKST